MRSCAIFVCADFKFSDPLTGLISKSEKPNYNAIIHEANGSVNYIRIRINVTMDKFRFKLSFCTPHHRFVADPGFTDLCADSCGAKVVVLVPGRKSLQKDERRQVPDNQTTYAISGEPYSSAIECFQAAIRAKQAILTYAVRCSIAGIEFWDTGNPIADDVKNDTKIDKAQILLAAGVSIERVRGYSVDFRLDVLPDRDIPIENLVTEFGEEFRSTKDADPKLIAALELFLLSLLNTDSRTRFVTQVTAIEALMKPASESKKVIELVGQLQNFVSNMNSLDDTAARIVLDALNRTKTESKTKAGKKLVSSLLRDKVYGGGERAEVVFGRMYTVRSQIVHDGLPKNLSPKEFQALCKLSTTLVRDLLQEATKLSGVSSD